MNGSWLALGGLGLAGSLASHRADPVRPVAHVVEVRGMAFHPEELRVQRGDTILWINQDLVPHTATARDSSGWSTGILKQGEKAHWVAEQRGPLPYFCELHPTMKGTLIVK